MPGISTNTQMNNQLRMINRQQGNFNNLLRQLDSMKKASSLAGLGDKVMSSFKARSAFSGNTAYTNSLTHHSIKMELISQTTQELREHTENISKQITLFSKESLLQEGDVVTYTNPLTPDADPIEVGHSSAEPIEELRTLQNAASDIFDMFTDLLNVEDAEGYLFNGTDKPNKPLSDTSNLESAVAGLVHDWKEGNISNADLVSALQSRDPSQNPRAITDDIIGFSDGLSNGEAGTTNVRANNQINLKYTAHANEDGFRDVLVGLAFLKEARLTPLVDVYEGTNAPPNAPDIQGAPGATVEEMKQNFFDIFEDVAAMIDKALPKIDQGETLRETTRARMSDMIKDHNASNEVLKNTVANFENVDINEIAVQVSSLQTQLQASYAVTSMVRELSLVNYL